MLKDIFQGKYISRENHTDATIKTLQTAYNMVFVSVWWGFRATRIIPVCRAHFG